MRKLFFCVLPLIFLVLTACTKEVTEKDLIGGTWDATAGFEDGKVKGEPNCHPFEEGIEFKNDDTIYNISTDRDFEYWLYEDERDSKIHFEDSHPGQYNYRIKKISEDEIVLEGLDYSTSKGNFCYLERK